MTKILFFVVCIFSSVLKQYEYKLYMKWIYRPPSFNRLQSLLHVLS